MTEKTGLVKYDAMCRAISVCRGVDEVKKIRDQADAIRLYALQAKNIEAERQAAEIRIRAERRWGQLYSNGQKATGKLAGKDKDGDFRRSPGDTAETLTDLRVSKAQSSKWQKLAEASDKQFETALNKASANGVPTTTGVMRNMGVTVDANDVPSDPRASLALWVWGRVNQFAETIDDITPELCAGLSDEIMRDDFRKNLPALVKWLRDLQRNLK